MGQTPAQEPALRKQRKCKSCKYFDEKLRATNAQRNSSSQWETFFLLNVHDETADRRRATPTRSRPKTHRRVKGNSRDTTRDRPVRCRTVEQRIRSGGKSEGCKAQEVNAEEARNPSEKLRDMASPGAKQEWRSQLLVAYGALRAKQAAHWETVKKPCPCSNRDFDWTDRRASNRSTAYSADLASSRTRSPQIAGPTRRSTPRR